MSGQSLIDGASGLQVIGDPMTAWQVIISLLQQQNGNTMNGNQLIAATVAAGIPVINDSITALQVMIYLLANGSGGGGGGGGISSGNYAGGQPGFTPTGSTAIAVDTSNGRVWLFYNSTWQ